MKLEGFSGVKISEDYADVGIVRYLGENSEAMAPVL